jgi:polyhydroxybutyrate depolymerase
VADAISFWTRQDGCPTPPAHEGKGAIRRDLYAPCRNGTAVEIVTIQGGGHVWPGGEKWAAWAEEPTREISATEAMWEFFDKHPKR